MAIKLFQLHRSPVLKHLGRFLLANLSWEEAERQKELYKVAAEVSSSWAKALEDAAHSSVENNEAREELGARILAYQTKLAMVREALEDTRLTDDRKWVYVMDIIKDDIGPLRDMR